MADAWLDEAAAGLVSLIHIFNIPYVVLGGGIMEQPYLNPGVPRGPHRRHRAEEDGRPVWRYLSGILK